MFIIPLLILMLSYISTFRTISSNLMNLIELNSPRAKRLKIELHDIFQIGSERVFKVESTVQPDQIRRSDSNRQKLIHKAKMKSLRISVVIVAAFIICWTP